MYSMSMHIHVIQNNEDTVGVRLTSLPYNSPILNVYSTKLLSEQFFFQFPRSDYSVTF